MLNAAEKADQEPLIAAQREVGEQKGKVIHSNMVVKQSSGSEASTSKALPLPKNQNWMSEFEQDSGPDESASSYANGVDENFAELFEASQKNQEIKEGEVVDGNVVAVGPEYVTVDIGYKCEGLVPLQEFKDAHGETHIDVGDVISVYLERMELENGFMLLSKEKAEMIRAWDEISQACERDELIEGTIIAR